MNTPGGRLQGKVAVVTGAAAGIGLAIAERFAEEGACVVATDVDTMTLAASVATLCGEGHLALALDVCSEAGWEQVLSETVQRLGGVDVLVNNAGIPAHGSIEDTSLEDWRRVIAVNLDGVFLGCKHAIRHMKARGGAIVNVSSVGALKGSVVGPAYGASKAGVWNLSKTVALYCARAGYAIRCNSLHPGLTQTPMMSRAPVETINRLKAGIPLGRLAEARDIANAALYLASDEAAYATGSALVIDGGYTI